VTNVDLVSNLQQQQQQQHAKGNTSVFSRIYFQTNIFFSSSLSNPQFRTYLLDLVLQHARRRFAIASDQLDNRRLLRIQIDKVVDQSVFANFGWINLLKKKKESLLFRTPQCCTNALNTTMTLNTTTTTTTTTTIEHSIAFTNE
jgi:hypothetical protein